VQTAPPAPVSVDDDQVGKRSVSHKPLFQLGGIDRRIAAPLQLEMTCCPALANKARIGQPVSKPWSTQWSATGVKELRIRAGDGGRLQPIYPVYCLRPRSSPRPRGSSSISSPAACCTTPLTCNPHPYVVPPRSTSPAIRAFRTPSLARDRPGRESCADAACYFHAHSR